MSSLERSAAVSAVMEIGMVCPSSAILRAVTITVSNPLLSVLCAKAGAISADAKMVVRRSMVLRMSRPEQFLLRQRFTGDGAKNEVRQDGNTRTWDFFPIRLTRGCRCQT